MTGIDHSFEPDPELAERRRRESVRWRERSRRIALWRRVLPLAGLGLAGLLLLWIAGRGFIADLMSPKDPEGAAVRMVNPRFYGRDSNNRAFVISAGAAVRESARAKTVTLNDPRMVMDAEGPNPTQVRADQGVYLENRRQVRLKGQVSLSNGKGYRFDAAQAVIDTQTGRVTGENGVQGEGPLGRVAAKSYGVYDGGRRIVFRGGVRARIDQAAGKAAPTETGR